MNEQHRLPAPNPPRRNWLAVWRWPKWRLAVVAVLFATLSGYIMLYWALLGGSIQATETITSKDGGQVTKLIVLPVYRTESLPDSWSDPLITLIAPAHEIDRWLRPKYWSADPGTPSK